MSTAPGERIEHWRREEGHTDGEVLASSLCYDEAQALEKKVAKELKCEAAPGGPRIEGQVWSVYCVWGGPDGRRNNDLADVLSSVGRPHGPWRDKGWPLHDVADALRTHTCALGTARAQPQRAHWADFLSRALGKTHDPRQDRERPLHDVAGGLLCALGEPRGPVRDTKWPRHDLTDVL